MRIEVTGSLTDEEVTTAWELYRKRFAYLAGLAVQRHLMSLPEFHYVCQDPNVQKWRVFDQDDDLVGLATYTNVLESMPLISPEYFAIRYPVQYAAGQVWHCGFVCVADEADSTAFMALITRMYRQAAEHGGLISIDYCNFNTHLAKLVKVALTRLAGGTSSGFRAYPADTQTYWVYVTPPVEQANGVQAA